ncbi:hypothetical protein IGI04_001795 [Brassica rapa subsp. trilocularis]|uniref:Uncharacterized protein n=1 Tax=Brassica rapa subsp. trilocularis TaxID=1813537 RepID=A0ABQ7NTN4_BRACM|nr:hypothetical protein IGI04_001795 [Brassica rapa subsp. trilocularis]
MIILFTDTLTSVRISSRFIVIAPVRALIVSHAVDGSPLRPSLKVSRDDVVKPFGSLSTGVVIFWGVPHFSSVTVSHNHRDSPMLCNCNSGLTAGKALTFEVVTSQNPRFMKHRSDLPPSPLVMVYACLLSHRGGDLLRRASPRRLRLISEDRRSAPTLTPSSVPLNRRCSLSGDPSSCQRQRNSIAQACEMGLFACRLGLVSLLNFIQSHSIVSKPICLWGRLVYLANLLKNSDGFIGLFTETIMLTMSYLSFLKRTLIIFLPVGSLGSLSSSSPYSSPSSSSPAFSRRSVSPSAHVRRCISKSITVLLSCGAVRSGPEDAADLVSTIFRGADWISTSLFNVTKFQPSGTAVILTHSSFAMNSLSLYLRGFSKSIVCVVWFYVCSSMNSCRL